MTRLLSIIVPVFNERDNIAPLIERLGLVIDAIKSRHNLSFEVIINDNHSTDGTFEWLKEAVATHDERSFVLKVYRFAKNIGFQKSILVGYAKAEGDAVIQIDADLQDPPELIETFIERWQEGYQVVYGIRRSRQEGVVITGLRRLYYRLVDRLSHDPLPHDSGDFRLVDRSLVDVVVALRDQDPYLRGLFASLGMRQTGIPYDRARRERGDSKFRFRDLLRLSWDGITNHSVVPLKLSTYLALGIMLIGGTLALFYLASWMILEREMPHGFMTIVLLQLASLELMTFILGVQGEYIGRIYAQVKEKPLAIVAHRLRSHPGPLAAAPRTVIADDIEVIWTGGSERGGSNRGGRRTDAADTE